MASGKSAIVPPTAVPNIAAFLNILPIIELKSSKVIPKCLNLYFFFPVVQRTSNLSAARFISKSPKSSCFVKCVSFKVLGETCKPEKLGAKFSLALRERVGVRG